MGGPERLARHHGQGKLDARARVEALLDPGSFAEIGTLVGEVPSDGIVAGAGRIDGRPVMVGAEDFTTRRRDDRQREQRQALSHRRAGAARPASR